ncbi:MAG TPA: hypothetical protein VGC03_14095 [Acidimicrobiia bacterium]|jgi:hypothetical protein
MIDLDRHLDLGSRQLKSHVAAFPTPTFREPKPASRLRAGLAAAAVTVAVILPVAGFLGSGQPATTGTETTQPTPVDTDFEVIVGEFTKAEAVAGFSEPRDFVEGAGLTGFGMVAVGHHTELDSRPKAWVAPDDGIWSAIDLSSVDLTGVELFLDVKEIDGQLAILALDILEYDGDPSSRRLMLYKSADLTSWTIKELTGIEAFALGFTNVTGITTGDAYSLQSVTRFGTEMVAIGVPAGADANTVIRSVDGGQTWAPILGPVVAGLPDELESVAASATGVVAVGMERVMAESEEDAGTASRVDEVSRAIIVWSADRTNWDRAALDLGDAAESRMVDVISIDGGFLARGSLSDTAGNTLWALWASNTGASWERVSIPEIEGSYGHLDFNSGILTHFASPSLEDNSDRTGAIEIWQGTIGVSDRPQS